MGDEKAEGLWVRVRGQTNMGDVVGVFYRLPGQEEVDEVFRQLEKSHVHWPWSSWGTWSMVISSGVHWQHLIEKLMMGGALLVSYLRTRKGRLGMWRLGATLAAVTMMTRVQELERREQGKNQDYNPGLQWKGFGLFQRSAWKNVMQYIPGEKRGQGELVDSQGSPSPSSRVV